LEAFIICTIDPIRERLTDRLGLVETDDFLLLRLIPTILMIG